MDFEKEYLRLRAELAEEKLRFSHLRDELRLVERVRNKWHDKYKRQIARAAELRKELKAIQGAQP